MHTITAERDQDFAHAVVAGLSRPQKSIPARFFYDYRGSQLFEAITGLPEYYPTRTETALLSSHAGDVARLAGEGGSVIEFGAGSAAKTPLLLDALRPSLYVPIDISGAFLEATAASLAASYPAIAIHPVVADFGKALTLPAIDAPVTGFFPGSTLGNFAPPEAVDLLRAFRATLGDDATLVIGLDTRKNQRLLEAAYDDADGITAAFNLNLLERINRELDGTVPIDLFEHRAVWHEGHGRIEMHLAATRALQFTVGGHPFAMRAGETIHTENSYKYSRQESDLLARSAWWEPMAGWRDPEELFSLHVWKAAERSA